MFILIVCNIPARNKHLYVLYTSHYYTVYNNINKKLSHYVKYKRISF
jgi:hypothetical protein